MVRVVARQHCVRLKCSVVQQRSDAQPWLAAVAAVAYCRRCIMLAQNGLASRCKCFKRWQKCGVNPRPGDFAVLLSAALFCSAHDAHR